MRPLRSLAPVLSALALALGGVQCRGAEWETQDPKLKSVAPKDTVLENANSRMQWIKDAAKRFHDLMGRRLPKMEQHAGSTTRFWPTAHAVSANGKALSHEVNRQIKPSRPLSFRSSAYC